MAVIAIALVAAACGGGEDTGSGTPPATTTAAAVKPVETGFRGIRATVSGRTLVGRCTSRRSDQPTVVLEVGNGAPIDSLTAVQDHFKERTAVCTYARAGTYESTPSTKPRPVTEVVSDLHAFLDAVGAERYFLVGHSVGGQIVFLYAQAHPDKVAGFVSINPHPPSQPWLKRARTFQTEAEIRKFELPDFQGDNPEGIEFRGDESMLTDPLPADLPYAVMFDESCEELPPELQDRCPRLVGLLAKTNQELAKVGKGGRFVWAKGTGHDMHLTQPEVVLKTVDQVWKQATSG
jgi:pimeloyl-ACP methyl ester carboxylesterase